MRETISRSHHTRQKPRAIRGAICTLVLAPTLSTACQEEPLPREEGGHELADERAPVSTVQRPHGLCARPADDAVRDIFCAAAPPSIRSLRDLQDRLGLNLRTGEPAAPVATNALSDVAVFLTHSTALSGRLVSPINPRAFVFGAATVLTYQRGVQQVEIVTQDYARSRMNFYLVSFTQACNEAPRGCLPGDLYTPRVEAGWTKVSLNDDEDLKNTARDCRQCHQRGRDEPVLLMRELQSPWTHFFEPEYLPEGGDTLPGVRGRDLLLDYLRAKGDEPYAEVSSADLRHTVGVFLQNVVVPNQPLLFDAPRIEEERWPFGPDGYPGVPRPSESWEAAYEAFKRGDQLALPYFEPRATDPVKLARLTEAYTRFRNGQLPAEALPDLADIFPDDPAVRAKIGLDTAPDAAPASLLIQACGSCHNDVLDQTITRARFNIDLARMSQEEIDLAIARIALSPAQAGVMPPPEFRQLDASAKARLTAWLRAGRTTEEDRRLLQHAAEVGMTGGGRP